MRIPPALRVYYLEPGYVIAPLRPTALAAVVSSGVAISLYDIRRQCGGMCHYVWPVRRERSSSVSAAPAIACLTAMFTDGGSRIADLEAYICGGADNRHSARHCPGLSKKNVEVGTQILTKLRIPVAGIDTGGYRGRKVMFHSGTGESVIARLAGLEEAYWYPQLTY